MKKLLILGIFVGLLTGVCYAQRSHAGGAPATVMPNARTTAVPDSAGVPPNTRQIMLDPLAPRPDAVAGAPKVPRNAPTVAPNARPTAVPSATNVAPDAAVPSATTVAPDAAKKNTGVSPAATTPPTANTTTKVGPDSQ
jgi:hypothetical protein